MTRLRTEFEHFLSSTAALFTRRKEQLVFYISNTHTPTHTHTHLHPLHTAYMNTDKQAHCLDANIICDTHRFWRP